MAGTRSVRRPRPIARGAIAPGDLAAAFAELAPKNAATRRAIAESLGIGWTALHDEAEEVRTPDLPEAAGPAEDDTPPPGAGARSSSAPEPVDLSSRELSPVVRSRMTRKRAAVRRPPPWLERVEPLERPEEAADDGTEAIDPLLSPNRSRGILSLALATERPVGELDLATIVHRIARGDALAEIPRLPVETLARGVQLLLDVSDAMLPFLEDVDQIEHRVRALAGDDRLAVLRFAGCPTRGAGQGPEFAWRRDWGAIRPPARGMGVLCVSDLGIGRPVSGDAPATASEWLEYHARLRSEACPLLVLNPYPPERWPPRLSGRLPILHWARTTTAAAAAKAVRGGGNVGAGGPLREDEPTGLRRLAEIVSLAVRAEPALVRRARHLLVPEADPGVEADLWFHPLVRHASAEGIVLEPEAGESLRRRLAERDPDLYESAWRLTRACHRSWSPALRLEEEVHYLAHSRSPDARQRIRRLLATALAALVAGDRRGLAGWAARALPRFPREVRELEEWAMLGAAAELRLDERIAAPEEERPRVADEWLPWIAPAARAEIAVRLRQGALEVESPPPEDESYHRLPLLATDPMVLEILPADAEVLRLEVRQGDSLAVRVDEGPIRLSTLLGEEYELEPEKTAEAREVLDFSGVFDRHQPVYEPDLEARLEDLFSRPDLLEGYVAVIAGPGLGKTALMVHLARKLARGGRAAAPHHFFRGRIPEWTDLRRAERSLIAQIDGLRPARKAASTSLESALRRWSQERFSGGESLVVVIDAADEAAEPRQLGALLPATLPAGVFVVVSAAPENEELSRLDRRAGNSVLRPPPPSEKLLERRHSLEGVPYLHVAADLPRAWWVVAMAADAGRVFGDPAGSGFAKQAQGFEDLVEAVWKAADENVRTVWALVSTAREALTERTLERLVGPDVLTSGRAALEVLLDRHQLGRGVSWIPRTPAVAGAVKETLAASGVERHHQILLGSVAAWPPAEEEADELSAEDYEERRRFSVRHALYHATGARNLPRVAELTRDLEYLEERLRIDPSARLVEDLLAALSVFQEKKPGEAAAVEEDVRLLVGILEREHGRLASRPEALASLAHNRTVERGRGPGAFRFRDGRPPELRLHRVHRLSTGDGGQEEVRGHRGPVRGARWFDDAPIRRRRNRRHLLSWSDDGSVLLWKPPKPPPRQLMKREGTPVVECLVLPSSPSDQVVAAFADGVVEVVGLDESASRSFRAHSGSLGGAGTLDAEEGRFFTFGASGQVRIWNVRGALLNSFHCHEGPVTAAVPVPGGRLATGGADGTVEIWDFERGEELARLEAHSAPVTALALGGTYLAAAGEDARLRLWEIETLRLSAVLRGHHLAVTAMGFDPDGGLVSASLDRTARRWNVATGDESAIFHHPSAVTGLAFADEARARLSVGGWPFVTSCADGCLRGFDLKSEAWRRNRAVDAHGLACRGCAVDPEGRSLVSWSDDGTLAIWDLGSAGWKARLGEPEPRRRPLVGGTRRWIGFGPRGAFEAHVDREELRHLGGPKGGSALMNVTVEGTDPERTRVAFWNERGVVEMFELTASSPRASDVAQSLSGGTRIDAIEAVGQDSEESDVRDCVLQGDSLIRARGLRLEVRRRAPGRPSEERVHNRRIAGCTPISGGRVLTWSWDGTLRIFDVEGLRPLKVLSGHSGPVLACVADREGERVLSASADASIRLWSVETASAVETWEEVSPHVTALSLDEDLELYLAGTAAGEVIALNPGWTEPVRAPGHAGVVRGFAPRIEPGSPRFYSIGDDGTLRLWDVLDSRELVAVATAYADAPLRSVSAVEDYVAAQDSWSGLWIYRHLPDGAESG